MPQAEGGGVSQNWTTTSGFLDPHSVTVGADLNFGVTAGAGDNGTEV